MVVVGPGRARELGRRHSPWLGRCATIWQVGIEETGPARVGPAATPETARQRGAALYERFDDLVGVHYLGLRHVGLIRTPISLSVLGTGDEVATVRLTGYRRHLHSLSVGGTACYVQQRRKVPGQQGRQQIVDVRSDRVWCTVEGDHHSLHATTRLVRPDGTTIVFPVFGTGRYRTVMIAQHGDGAPVAHLRLVRSGQTRRRVEAVADSSPLTSEEVLLVIGIGGALLYRYFEHAQVA